MDAVKNLNEMKKFWSVVETASQDKEIVKEEVSVVKQKQIQDVIYALEDFRENTKEQLRMLDRSFSKLLAQAPEAHGLVNEAKAYWFGHIKSAVGDSDYPTHATTVERTAERLKDLFHHEDEDDRDAHFVDPMDEPNY